MTGPAMIMEAEYLIENIRELGAGRDDDAVRAALRDGAFLGRLFCLGKLDPDDAKSVAEHAEAQAIAEEAYSLL